jgi:arylsulfatase A-like enzyme
MSDELNREPNEEPRQDDTVAERGISRRKFLGAVATAAAAGAFLGATKRALGQEQTYWFYDSTGTVVPVDPATIAAGITPPPLPPWVSASGISSPNPDFCETSNDVYVTKDYQQPNILLLMVDQLRFPRWLTSSQQTVFQQQIMPNLFGPSGYGYTRNGTTSGLKYRSNYFPNYFVAATKCAPSRATMLTGLYAQQTCEFTTFDIPLQPWNGGSGFPTIGDALSTSYQIGDVFCNGASPTNSTPYDTAWIGKWHLSDHHFGEGGPFDYIGENGPADYGFTNPYCLPTNSSSTIFPYPYPSPDGDANEGTGGYGLNDGVPNFLSLYNTTATPADPLCVADNTLESRLTNNRVGLSDVAIFHAFNDYWRPVDPTTTPWFLGLSFINPHDSGAFPWAYGLVTTSSGACNATADLGCPNTQLGFGYYPPPVLGWNEQSGGDSLIHFNGLPYNMYGMGTSPPPNDYNYNDNVGSMPYNGGTGKPGVQAYYQNKQNLADGSVNSEEGWCQFLNYYYWLCNSVDRLIGLVLTGLDNSGVYGSYPLVIFTSDHGDFGGSHGLHAKGGALYDEVMNVPLLVSYPNQNAMNLITHPFSSVDLMPFILSEALGNESWRGIEGEADQPFWSYLSGRESIMDFIIAPNTAVTRRVANVMNSSGGYGLPYVLHTMDEFLEATVIIDNSTTHQPPHAVAFRTVDTAVEYNDKSNVTTFYGGGKLGMYTYWLQCETFPNTNAKAIQYEFYDYNTVANGGAQNYGELGNDAFSSGSWDAAGAGVYLNAYNQIMQDELYQRYSQVQTGFNTAFNLNYAHDPSAKRWSRSSDAVRG